MLVLQRKTGESVYIGDDVQVTVLAVEDGRVRLAIDAPKNIPILRSELRSAMDFNRDAANEELEPLALMDVLESILPGQGKPKPEKEEGEV